MEILFEILETYGLTEEAPKLVHGRPNRFRLVLETSLTHKDIEYYKLTEDATVERYTGVYRYAMATIQLAAKTVMLRPRVENKGWSTELEDGIVKAIFPPTDVRPRIAIPLTRKGNV